ncbi:MAG: aminotransferase class I/II-fold pyridoxal phosphate-dependent enzyme [Deltaproteobacteria bacterium]|jgi:aspartate/methionine/tyrosine aminotransferase|nr:aminotransferase class I/II-fold pyridoxal phosphate-dependent enzyme [Deltaproteobacteria bacterium]
MQAKRMEKLESSGIRKFFELAAKMKNPINLSLGQAHFPVPKPVRDAAIAAINEGKSGYSMTAGIDALKEAALNSLKKDGLSPEAVMVTSGAEGGLMTSMLALADEDCEVLLTDPCFATYGHLVKLADSKIRRIDTYPDFRLTPEKLKNACTEKTKILLFNSPANPTGVAYTDNEIAAIAKTAKELGLQVISDEVYDKFCYDHEHVSFAKYDPSAVTIRAFSKTWGIAGWRVGYAFGPKEIIDNMIMLQQFTFICSPMPFQCAAAAAFDTDISDLIQQYRVKRDMVYDGMRHTFELNRPEGAFYAFCKPRNIDNESFIKRCIENEILVVPGSAFGEKNTHFRVSFATDDETLKRGIDLLVKLGS